VPVTRPGRSGYLVSARESCPFRERRVFRRPVGTEERTGRA
jgi:hypothetical protein